jgi:uncharacterized damage-inducible protein DinB
MNKEITYLARQLQTAYEGEPWFGRNIRELISEVDIQTALYKTDEDQHSILELVYHMLTWREFTISRIEPDQQKDLKYFEDNDWRKLDHGDESLWQEGLKRLDESQKKLLALISNLDDSYLSKEVDERKYNFRFLLNGIIQHDIYHAGQIAYIRKMVASLKTDSL